MKSMFRIYARTSKPNDPYLYQQLCKFGLKPKYEELMHSFYFNAKFNDIFNLSFHSLTAQSLYVQLGHKFPLRADFASLGRTNEDMAAEFYRKINFANYIPVTRGIVENISLNILIRQSSPNIPSENVLLSLLKNHLQKQVVMREYKKMGQLEGLENYYDIKQIVHRKWEHQDRQMEEQFLIQNKPKQITGPSKSIQNQNNQLQNMENRNQIGFPSQQITYQPHFVLYIRRNHARLLLKLNKQPMYKHGWKKKVGWAPIRQSLVASVLYQTNIFNKQKNKEKITLWDPFCGSGTIPLVACSIFGNLRVRQDILSNFTWVHWPIYKQQYLSEYISEKKEKQGQFLQGIRIVGSDIDMKAINNSLQNFNAFLQDHVLQKQTQTDRKNEGLTMRPNLNSQIFELLPQKIYLGMGDFQKIGQIFKQQGKTITIVTNIPYLGERSKQHMPLNQLKSVYNRFNKMIKQNSNKIRNVFVIVNADQKQNRNHFMRISTQEWRIMGHFQNGGIHVNLLAWSKNKDGWGNVQIWNGQSVNEGMVKYDAQKQKNLEQYRQAMKQIEAKRYEVPKYMIKHKGMTGYKRIIEKRKARQLRAAYLIFAKRKDRDQTYQKYAQKQLALKLSQRGRSWKMKNISILNSKLEEHEDLIKQEFEKRIQEALAKSEQRKEKKKNKKDKVVRKW